jgi:hypothetical protein
MEKSVGSDGFVWERVAGWGEVGLGLANGRSVGIDGVCARRGWFGVFCNL